MKRFVLVAWGLGLSVLGAGLLAHEEAARAAEGPVPLSTCSSRYARTLAQAAQGLQQDPGSQQELARDWKAFSKAECGVENWRVPGVRLAGGPHVVRASLVVPVRPAPQPQPAAHAETHDQAQADTHAGTHADIRAEAHAGPVRHHRLAYRGRLVHRAQFHPLHSRRHHHGA